MMKCKLLLGVFLLLLCGCKANYPVSQQSGRDDMAYLLFVSSKEYVGKTVDVYIDGVPDFEAKVVRTKKSNRRGTQYGISVGRKKITVKCDGKTLYSKQLFLSNQEIKQIILP